MDKKVFDTAKAYNGEFVNTFEEFLREVWIGIVNVKNESGSNPTDNAEIANLAEKLYDMLTTRRLGGNLAIEEMFFVFPVKNATEDNVAIKSAAISNINNVSTEPLNLSDAEIISGMDIYEASQVLFWIAY